MKPRVGVDVDGVLADLHSAGLAIINQILGSGIPIQDLTTWDLETLVPEGRREEFWAQLDRRGFHDDLRPLPGSQEGLAALQDVAEVYVVTSYVKTSPTWVYERDKWLHEHFYIPRSHVIHTRAKHCPRANDSGPHRAAGEAIRTSRKLGTLNANSNLLRPPH